MGFNIICTNTFVSTLGCIILSYWHGREAKNMTAKYNIYGTFTWHFIGISIVYRYICVYYFKIVTETFWKIFAWMKKKTCGCQRIYKWLQMLDSKYGCQMLQYLWLTCRLHRNFKRHIWHPKRVDHRCARTSMVAKCKIFVNHHSNFLGIHICHRCEGTKLVGNALGSILLPKILAKTS